MCFSFIIVFLIHGNALYYLKYTLKYTSNTVLLLQITYHFLDWPSPSESMKRYPFSASIVSMLVRVKSIKLQ